MATQDAINAARFAYAAYDAFLAGVAQEMGMERTLALQAKAMESMGVAQGQMLKEQTGIEQADAQTVYAVLSQMLDGIGFITEVLEAGPQRIAFKAGQCPIFEAAQVVGFDRATVEAICRSGGICFMDAVTRQLNPNLCYRLHAFRSSADDACVEEIVVA